MHRVMRRLDRADAREARGNHRTPDRDLGRRLLVGLSTLAVIVAGCSVFAHEELGLRLTRHGLIRAEALGHPPAVATGAGTFRFMQHQRGRPATPVAYSPCQVIHVVVNEQIAPPGARAVLAEAIGSVSAATGLVFRVDGSTSELPSPRRPTRDALRYGKGWSPVLVAWTTPAQLPRLAGDIAGLGGSTPVADAFNGTLRYVTGTVSLDAPQLSAVLQRARGRDEVRAIVMHELGHLVGLAHVSDPTELMFADNTGLTDFGPGDREGLAALGKGVCSN
jgi:hypothetical protein